MIGAEAIGARFAGRAGRALEQLSGDTLRFAVLRALTMVGGVAALLAVPLSPEHRPHLAPLLAGFILYKSALLAVLLAWSHRVREIFLATLAADLSLVFLLVWFTGGGGSHFYLLFFPLVALHAYYFGPGIGALAAALAAGLLALANWLAPPATPWTHIAARAALLALVAVPLGQVAARERRARATAEALNRKMEAALAELGRAERLAAVGRLSAKMAHEVRNPLGAIALNAEMLGDIVRECAGPSMGEARELLDEIREEIRGLAELTDEYLVAARLPRPRLEKESLNDLVSELAAFLRPVADGQGVTIALDLDPALPSVPVDRAMLKQAIRNLTKNSLEMLPRGGQVTLSTRAGGEVVSITVADDGPGVSPEAARHLFEPFFTTKARGTGLGLSIAAEIAREHGGELTWTPRTPRGAEFTIRLPLGGDGDA